MITNSVITQHSINTAWKETNSVLPAGLILDIQITLPYNQSDADKYSIIISRLVADSTHIELALSSVGPDEVIFATINTSTLGVPQAFNCLAGYDAHVVFGALPANKFTFVSNESIRCIISPELVLFENINITKNRSSLKITTTSSSSSLILMEQDLLEDTELVLDTYMCDVVNGTISLSAVGEATAIDEAEKIGSTNSEVISINGVKNRDICIVINNCIVSPGLYNTVCYIRPDANIKDSICGEATIDIIDKYISPYMNRSYKKLPLDVVYVSDADGGFVRDLMLLAPNEHYDNLLDVAAAVETLDSDFDSSLATETGALVQEELVL